MHERPTDNGRRQTAKEVHSQSKVGDSEGMGFYRKRGGGVPSLWDSSLTLYRWKKRLEQGAAEFLKGGRAKPNPEVKELQRENQKLKDTVTLLSQELMLLKKKMNLV
jgi:hypothetical protein